MSPGITKLVKVTADDIAAGKPHDAGACPVALAMNRQVAAIGGWDVSTAPARDGHMVGVARWAGTIPVAIRLSRPVASFVRAFDAGKPVQPFAFWVWR